MIAPKIFELVYPINRTPSFDFRYKWFRFHSYRLFAFFSLVEEMAYRIKLNTDRVTKYFYTAFFLTGIWRPFRASRPIRLLYDIFGVTCIFVFSIFFACSLLVNLMMNLKAPGLTNRLFITVQVLSFTYKVTNIFINNANCQKIRETLNNFLLYSSAEEDLLRKKIDSFWNAMIAYWLIPNFTVIAWQLNTTLMGSQTLIFDAWYPGFDWQNNRHDYWIVSMHQFISSVITSNLNGVTDMYYAFAMYVNGMKLEVLGNRLSSIQRAGSLKSIEETLIIHMRTFQEIKDAIEVLKKDLKWAYFSQVLLSSIVLCGCTRELAKVH